MRGAGGCRRRSSRAADRPRDAATTSRRTAVGTRPSDCSGKLYHPRGLNVIETSLPGVLVIEPRVFADERGFFMETYHSARFHSMGLDAVFVQDNHSRSV